MNTHLALKPDLTANALEDRTLPASFLESTFFEFSFTSGMSPFQYSPAGTSTMYLADPELALGGVTVDDGSSTYSGAYASNFGEGSSYFGFGSNLFGSGLSPLSGVAEAYSMDTALSDIVGGGSTLPGGGSLGDGFPLPLPGNLVTQSPGAPAVAIGLTAAGRPGGPRGYGSVISSGFNFGLSSMNNYGMSPGGVGVAPSTQGPHGGGGPVDRAPGTGGGEAGASRGAGGSAQTGAGNLGQGPINTQVNQPPSRRAETPAQGQSRPDQVAPPTPEGHGIPDSTPKPPADAPPADAPPANPGGETLIDRVLKVPSSRTP